MIFTMKVLNVIWTNSIGGVQVRVLSIAKKLKRYGIDTVVVVPKEEGNFAQWATQEGLKTYQIKLDRPQYFRDFRSIFTNVRWVFTFLFSVFAIARIIRKEDIDLVHVNGILSLQAPVAALLTRRKIVWHLIGSVYPKIVVSSLMPFVKLLSCKMILVAKKMEQYYFGHCKGLVKNKTLVIPEPVDSNKFNPANVSQSDKDRLKAKFNIGPYEKVVGFVGNISFAKDLEYFIQSAKLIKNEVNNVKFLIVGGTSKTQKNYHQWLTNLISSLGMKQDIIFTGMIENVVPMLSLFDVFLLTSVAEGTPIAILEAMSMEIPVVATDVGGVSEQVINGETGILVPPKNPEAISRAVIRLLKNKKERINMKKRARKRVKEVFSPEKCVRRHVELYQMCTMETA